MSRSPRPAPAGLAETLPAAPADGATPPWPTTVAELDDRERLVIYAFRSWVSGQQEWARAADILAARLETDPAPALRALTTLIVAITRGARRRVRYHRPGCPCLGADEAWFLCLTAAAQARHLRLTDALARWIVHEEAAADLVAAAQGFGTALSAAGVRAPLRTAAGAAAGRGAPTLHTVH